MNYHLVTYLIVFNNTKINYKILFAQEKKKRADITFSKHELFTETVLLSSAGSFYSLLGEDQER